MIHHQELLEILQPTKLYPFHILPSAFLPFFVLGSAFKIQLRGHLFWDTL